MTRIGNCDARRRQIVGGDEMMSYYCVQIIYISLYLNNKVVERGYYRDVVLSVPNIYPSSKKGTRSPYYWFHTILYLLSHNDNPLLPAPRSHSSRSPEKTSSTPKPGK